jgi:hypothetical protein
MHQVGHGQPVGAMLDTTAGADVVLLLTAGRREPREAPAVVALADPGAPDAPITVIALSTIRSG